MENARDVELRHLREDLQALGARVDRVESALQRGLYLLVANLAAVIAGLAQGLLRP